MPDISVVMPVRNGERYLQQTIASIRNQTHRDFEFVMVNDGSTDTTRDIMQAEAAADSRIRVFDMDKPVGIAAAVNYGISQARTPLIARMDGDDVAMPGRLAAQVGFMRQHRKIAACGTGMYHIDENNALLDMDWRHPSDPDEIHQHLRKYGNCIMNPTSCFRRKVFDALGGYRKPFEPAEDYDLWLRMTRKYKIANIDDKLLYYRHHGGQVSEEKRAIQEAGARAAIMEDASFGS